MVCSSWKSGRSHKASLNPAYHSDGSEIGHWGLRGKLMTWPLCFDQTGYFYMQLSCRERKGSWVPLVLMHFNCYVFIYSENPEAQVLLTQACSLKSKRPLSWDTGLLLDLTFLGQTISLNVLLLRQTICYKQLESHPGEALDL